MFTGIVETIGCINHLSIKNGCKYFTIAPKTHFHDLTIGESISINGACLSVTGFSGNTFAVTVVPETLRLTNLDHLVEGSEVNLERAVQLHSRIGGNQVQGHVDGMGKILELKNDHSDAWLVKISIPEKLSRYVVPKGYIALDGMSITVIDTAPNWFTVTFIPHTLEVTITNQYKPGSPINIEVDIMGKYIEKLLGAYQHVSAN